MYCTKRNQRSHLIHPVINKLSYYETDENSLNEDKEINEEIDIEEEDDSEFEIEYEFEATENELEESHKVRIIVRMCRPSPLKNEALQADPGIDSKELSLILDSKMRWNSLANMLPRFYKLRNCREKELLCLKPDILTK